MTRILTLSGWAQSSDALRNICPDGAEVTALDYSSYADYDALAVGLNGQEYELVMGWSLGGQLAVRLLGQGAIFTEKLVLLCAPHQFVRGENGDASYGMERWLFEQFYENYTSDPVRTAKRFAGLIAKGDARMKEIIREMMPHAAVHEVSRWASWLGQLGEVSLSAEFLSKLPETLMIHGVDDQLVKPAQSVWMAKHISNVTLNIIEGCAHAPHLHDAAAVKQMIAEWAHG